MKTDPLIPALRDHSPSELVGPIAGQGSMALDRPSSPRADLLDDDSFGPGRASLRLFTSGLGRDLSGWIADSGLREDDRS